MSRAFVKEDASHEPVVIPPRAPLPAGTPNYVTPRGLTLLQAELRALLEQQLAQEAAAEDDEDQMRALAVVRGRIAALRTRLAAAKLVEPPVDAATNVRFGATVRLRPVAADSGREPMDITIVGVDEADAGSGRVSFLAPIARQLLGKAVGERVQLPSGKQIIDWEIDAIA